MAPRRYAFGDTATAAERLRVVAEVFEPEIRAFLAGAVGHRPRLALDLGCGPGYSTSLVAEVLKPDAVIGLDTSTDFLKIAYERDVVGGSFVQHDVTASPFPVPHPDLVFVHFLLTHLDDPAGALETWTDQLSPSGIILVDEVEEIRTNEPTLRRYLDVAEALVDHHGGNLYVGPVLDALPLPTHLEKRSSDVATLDVRTADAATMFRLNLSVWRDDPFIRAKYTDEAISVIESELTKLTRSTAADEIVWRLRQIVFEKGV